MSQNHHIKKAKNNSTAGEGFEPPPPKGLAAPAANKFS